MASNEWKAITLASGAKGGEIVASIVAQHEEAGWEVVTITEGKDTYTAFLRRPRHN